MKKKITLLIISILLLSGCSATFDTVITKEMVKQDIQVNMKKTEKTTPTIYRTITSKMLEIEYGTEILSYYSFKNINDTESETLNSSISYSTKFYDNDYALLVCFSDHNIYIKDNVLVVQTSNDFTCFNRYKMMDTITVNVKTDLKVISNNADISQNGVYTWNFTKANNSKSIQLQVLLEDQNNPNDPNKPVETQKPQKNKFDFKSLIASFITIILILSTLSIIYLKIKKDGEKNNTI